MQPFTVSTWNLNNIVVTLRKMNRLQKKHFYDYEWKKNPNTIYVGRPSKWGNPFKIPPHSLEDSLWNYWNWITKQLHKDTRFLDPLRGKDLVCFCPLNQRCHADVLIKYIETLESVNGFQE